MLMKVKIIVIALIIALIAAGYLILVYSFVGEETIPADYSKHITKDENNPKAYDISQPIYPTKDDCLKEANPSTIKNPLKSTELLYYDKDECAYLMANWKEILKASNLEDCPAGCIPPYVYGYDQNGQKTRRITYDGSGNLAYKKKMKYDSRGNLIQAATYDASGNLLEDFKEYRDYYSDNGNQIKSVYYKDGFLISITLKKYNAANQLSERFSCSGKGDLISREMLLPTEMQSRHSYKRETNGGIIEEISQAKPYGTTHKGYNIIRTYNQKGEMLKEEVYDALDKLIEEKTYDQKSPPKNSNILSITQKLCPQEIIREELQKFQSATNKE